MRISVIGTGYVGLVSGACFAAIGHDSTCVDLDLSKVERINRGEAPIHEQGLPALLAQYVGRTLRATTDLAQAVLTTDITFIAVGTPFDGQRIDLGYVRDAARQIGLALRDKPGYHVVVVKSTVVPGTTDDVVLPELERASGRKAGIDFGVGMNPEFLTEGTAIEDFMRPDRIVIGGNDERTLALQREVYAPFRDTPLVATGNKTAEMIKYASNAVLATMISFSNEMGNLSSAIGGVDIADVLRGVHLSRYFTHRLEDGRTVEAPITAFLWAGCGYGGSCLPKDTKALAAHGRAIGTPMPLLEAVIDTNLGQPARLVALLERRVGDLRGLRVALLGLAFKPDTDDMRESPAIAIARLLLERGASVAGYDPVAGETARAAMPAEVRLLDSLDDAVAADVLVLVTRWDEFARLPVLLGTLQNPPLLLDGRRMIDPRAVPRYAGIGA